MAQPVVDRTCHCTETGDADVAAEPELQEVDRF
jgi:hypothetical protein